MCGIAGQIGRRGAAAFGDNVLYALQHRGPDSQHTERYTSGGVNASLAFTRLAIVDLSQAGQQPMSSEDCRYSMVFNGEIYNFPELRRGSWQAGRAKRNPYHRITH